MKDNNRNVSTRPDYRWAVLAVILLASFLLRLHYIEHRSVWMDEDRQANYALKGWQNLDLVKDFAGQAQPPTDLWFQSVGLTNVGISKTGVRIHALLLGVLSALLFYLMMTQLVNNRWAVWLSSAIFVFHPWLVRYSQEGRPIATGIFFAILYLWMLLRFLAAERKEAGYIRALVFFFIAQTWFLLSVGFQPLVFLLTSSVALLPMLFRKESFRKVLSIYVSGLFSFALFYPVLNVTLQINARVYLKQETLLERMLSLLKNIFSISFETYYSYFEPLVKHFEIFFILAFGLGIAGYILALRSEKRNTVSRLAPYLFIFILLYPIFFQAVFKTMIRYEVSIRYYLTFAPVLLAGLGVALYYTFFLLSRLARKAPRKWAGYLIQGLLPALFAFSLYGNFTSLNFIYRFTGNAGWEKVYRLLKDHAFPGDSAYILGLNSPGKYAPSVFRGTKFYYPDEAGQWVNLRREETIVDDYPALRKGERKGDIYFVFQTGQGRVKNVLLKKKKSFPLGSGDPVVDIFPFRRLLVVRIKDNGKIAGNILEFFALLGRTLAKQPQNYLVHENLFRMYMYDGRLGKAEFHLRTLEAMAKHKKLEEKIKNFKVQWQDRKAGRKLLRQKKRPGV